MSLDAERTRIDRLRVPRDRVRALPMSFLPLPDARRADPARARQGLATLLDLKAQWEGGSKASDGVSFTSTVDATEESVRSLQRSIQSLSDVLAKRRRSRDVLVVEVDEDAAVSEDPPAEDAEHDRQSLREKQRLEREAARAAKGEPSLVRTRMVRLALVLFMGLVVSPLVAHFAPLSAFAVATHSMEPGIPQGSLVLAADREPREGDVVVYMSAFGEYQIHRIIEVLDVNGETGYTTRGDANEAADSFTVMQSDVAGVVVRSVPRVGHFWLIPMLVKVGALVVLIGAYVGITLWDRPGDKKARVRVARAALAAIVVLLPGAMASVSALYPLSTNTVGVNDPTPLPLVAGDEGTTVIAGDENSATATVGPMELWKEVVMWGCDPADETAAGCVITPPTAYTTVGGSITRIRMTDYTPAPTFYLEAYLKAAAGETVSVQLYDMNDGAVEPGTELSTTSTSLVLVRSPAFTLAGTRDYQFQTKTTGAAAAGEVRMVKLLSKQEDVTESITQITVSKAGRTSEAGPFRALARTALWLDEETPYDGTVTAWFEVVAEGVGTVRLRDVTENRNVANHDFNDATPTRWRSGGILGGLRDGNVHQVEVDTGGGETLDVYIARIIFYQNGFKKTQTYVDLSATATTTNTAFTEVGYDGRYHGENEWGPPEGYFEATMLNTQGGQTTSARLFDRTAGAAIAGSQIDVTSTAITRARSGLIQLNEANGTYAAEYKASAATAEIRNAWLIVKQGPTETFDHVLETQQVSGDCTWSFTLKYVSSTSLARLEEVRIRLASGASSQDQVVISNGVLTQSEGTAVTLVDGATDLRHIMVVDTDAGGTSTVTADLKGTCSGTGIHTTQRIVYEIE